MAMIYVVPAAGGRVRQPDRQSRVMPPEGAWVPRDAHYERLLAAGDVIATEAPKPAKPAPDADNSTPAPVTASSGRSRRASAASEE